MNPTTIMAELWADGVSITLASDGVNLVAPAGRLTPAQRQFIREHKPALIDFLLATRATTDAVIESAMRRCDDFDDGEAAREQMRQDCINTPTHLQADLLAHFQGKPSKFWN